MLIFVITIQNMVTPVATLAPTTCVLLGTTTGWVGMGRADQLVLAMPRPLLATELTDTQQGVCVVKLVSLSEVLPLL